MPAVKVFCVVAQGRQFYAVVMNAGADNDYSPGPYNITFSSEDVRVSFNISIVDDDILEPSEEFVLSIDSSSLPDGVTVGAQSNATVIIVDNNG